MAFNIRDLGVVAYLTGNGAAGAPGALKDKAGGAVAPVALAGNGAWVQSPTDLDCGTSPQLFVTLRGAIAVGTYKLQFLRQRLDENNPALWGFAQIQATRLDTGVAAALHTIAIADLAAPAGITPAQQDLVFMVSNQNYGAGKIRLWVQSNQAPNAADYIVLAASL